MMALNLKGTNSSQAIQAASAAAAGNSGKGMKYRKKAVTIVSRTFVSLTEEEMLVKESLREKKIRAFKRCMES